ncbi:hypothetical protein CDAR_115661 [Caerostris darwini]|uniref:Uncharacterized protein n=1 Tax=Caerostris darwini TaxID=1538125 RepID=A0AAV4PYN6_9ARAC|nr:hypothetical protein CDAR_115661 [Caerostris darwini]
MTRIPSLQPQKSSSHSNTKLTTVKPAHVSDRPSPSLSFNSTVNVSFPIPNTSSSSPTSNLLATPRYTNYKIKNDHKQRNLITNTTPSSKYKSSTSKSRPLSKFKKHYDTSRFEALASFVTSDDLENKSHTEHPDPSNSDDMLEYDATDLV